jgi:hypothetical protein
MHMTTSFEIKMAEIMKFYPETRRWGARSISEWHVFLNEDYGRTYRVMRIDENGCVEYVRSASGQQKRFRSLEAACVKASKLRGE